MQNGNSGGNDFEKIVYDIRKAFENRGGKSRGSGGGSGGPPAFNSDQLKGLPIILLIIGLGFLGVNGFYTVQPDEEAVITRFGRYHTTTGPGPHLKLPWVDRVIKVQSKRRQEQEFGYRKDRRRGGRHLNFEEESLMLTGDLNLAVVEWMVQYEISDPWKYLFRVKDVVQTIRDVSMSVMRRVVGDRAVTEVLTTGRADIALAAKELMQNVLDDYDMGLRVTTIELQSVDPPDSVKPAFNDVNEAKQEQEQAINKAQREYNRVIPEAKGRAEKMLADAKAYSIKAINEAKGDADHFLAVLEEYRKAPSITRKRLYVRAMEEVFSKTDGFTVVDKDINGLLPIYGQGLLSNQVEKKAH